MTREPTAPHGPTLPRRASDPRRRERYRGCLLGGAVGDALGAPVEFLSAKAIRERFGPAGIRDYAPAYGRLGAITDDTQMTLFCAEGMLRAHVRALAKGIGPVFASVTSHAYLRWLLTQGIRHPKLRREAAPGWLLGHRELFAQRAPGRTCVSALAAMPEFGAPADNDSKGCGTVMRVAPIGLYFAHQDDAAPGFDAMVFETGVEDAALTHGHPTGQLAAGFLALTIARVARGHELDVAIGRARGELLRHERHEETLAAVDLAVALAHSSPDDPAAITRLGEGWVAEEALAIALYCSLAAPDFETGVTRAVSHGGDSDSTGAIAGNLLGARLGEGAIPERWLRELELREVVGEVAEDLAACAEWVVEAYDETGEGEFYWGRYPGW